MITERPPLRGATARSYSLNKASLCIIVLPRESSVPGFGFVQGFDDKLQLLESGPSHRFSEWPGIFASSSFPQACTRSGWASRFFLRRHELAPSFRTILAA